MVKCPSLWKEKFKCALFPSVLLSRTLGLITPPPDRPKYHLISVIFSLCRYNRPWTNKFLFRYYFPFPFIWEWAVGLVIFLFFIFSFSEKQHLLTKLQGLVIRWNFLALPISIHIASSKAFVFKSLAHKWCKWYKMLRLSSHFPWKKDMWNMHSDQKDMEQYASKQAMPALTPPIPPLKDLPKSMLKIRPCYSPLLGEATT